MKRPLKRPLRFSIAVMLAAVAIIGIAFAWLSNTRERVATLNSLRANHSFIEFSKKQPRGWSPLFSRGVSVSHIVVPHSFDVQEVQRVFPEATVWSIDDDVAALNRCVYDHQGRFSFIGDLAVPLAQYLGQMGPLARDSLPALRTLTNDNDPKTAATARAAIAAIDPPPVKRP